ncbi:helix-turn-helix domain-containing protein [Microbacterium sp. NPDC079995]|uniref:helix-turn-helix transcriptional regulator n=1 Tax=unclassified Microbacterium TaxID=2609290 RepID=UPI00344DA0B4
MSTNTAIPTMTFLTPEELASMLQLPQRTLDDWRYRGAGPAWLRLGKHVRYRLAAVEQWLSSLEQSA